jgi:hypothetical protein
MTLSEQSSHIVCMLREYTVALLVAVILPWGTRHLTACFSFFSVIELNVHGYISDWNTENQAYINVAAQLIQVIATKRWCGHLRSIRNLLYIAHDRYLRSSSLCLTKTP